MRFSPALVWK